MIGVLRSGIKLAHYRGIAPATADLLITCKHSHTSFFCNAKMLWFGDVFRDTNEYISFSEKEMQQHSRFMVMYLV